MFSASPQGMESYFQPCAVSGHSPRMKQDPLPSSMPAFDRERPKPGPGSPNSRLDKADTPTLLASATCVGPAQPSSDSPLLRAAGSQAGPQLLCFVAVPLSQDSDAGISSPTQTLTLFCRTAPPLCAQSCPRVFLSVHSPGQGSRSCRVLGLKGLRALG